MSNESRLPVIPATEVEAVAVTLERMAELDTNDRNYWPTPPNLRALAARVRRLMDDA